jgi:hypothetical protein
MFQQRDHCLWAKGARSRGGFPASPAPIHLALVQGVDQLISRALHKPAPLSNVSALLVEPPNPMHLKLGPPIPNGQRAMVTGHVGAKQAPLQHLCEI